MACLFALGFWQLGQGGWLPAKAWLAQGLMQHAWTRAGARATAPRPWPWPGTEPVARLVTGKGDVELIVLAGGTSDALAVAPGHLSASVPPGEVGNSVIAGHRDTHFSFLKDLRRGDRIAVERLNGRIVEFEVRGMDVVDSRRGSIVLDTEAPMLTLVTDYPFDGERPGGSLRYVVTAALAAPATASTTRLL